MRRMRIERWCDFCWQDGRQEIAAADTSFVVAAAVAGPKSPPPKLLEPCETHAKMLTELIAVLGQAITYRPEEFKLAKPAPRAQPAAAAAVTAAAAPHTKSESDEQCRECGVTAKRRDLASHVWRQHVGQPKPPAPDHCPDCGARAPANVRVPTMWTARHRANEHGHDALEDAYAHVVPSTHPDETTAS